MQGRIPAGDIKSRGQLVASFQIAARNLEILGTPAGIDDEG